ncbi:MAG: division/cell wall cluster transcriptional repressor MraZ [Myxococcales bacterium]|nr:division/cell wall cluster transcriptional repressor MraZ [Myxococcales bacterium]
MFRGRYEHAIDGKGRTSLPSRFREVLSARGDSRIIVTTGLEPCLAVYPLAEWVAFEEELQARSTFEEAVALLRRIYVSGAIECELDKMGRLLIPAPLRKHANLQREALWVGMGSYVELWDKAAFDSLRAEVLADAAKRQEIAKRLAELGL